MSDQSKRLYQLQDLEGLESRVALSGAATVFVAPLVLTTTAATFPDRATGAVKLVSGHAPSQIKVYGSLSNISNVSAVVLRLAPAKTSSSATPTPTPTPDPTSTEPTIAVLLKPGTGSGALRHATFSRTLTRFDLIGPLVNRPLSALIAYAQQKRVDVVVQTTSGVDASTQNGPGNFPSGELKGTLQPIAG
jgi:hypothetical protein